MSSRRLSNQSDAHRTPSIVSIGEVSASYRFTRRRAHTHKRAAKYTGRLSLLPRELELHNVMGEPLLGRAKRVVCDAEQTDLSLPDFRMRQIGRTGHQGDRKLSYREPQSWHPSTPQTLATKHHSRQIAVLLCVLAFAARRTFWHA